MKRRVFAAIPLVSLALCLAVVFVWEESRRRPGAYFWARKVEDRVVESGGRRRGYRVESAWNFGWEAGQISLARTHLIEEHYDISTGQTLLLFFFAGTPASTADSRTHGFDVNGPATVNSFRDRLADNGWWERFDVFVAHDPYNDRTPTTGAKGVWFPVWPLAVASAVLPALWLKTFVRHRWRWRKGLCPGCGYDLTANLSGVCPECGRPIAEGER